jgi:hypothetical protein
MKRIAFFAPLFVLPALGCSLGMPDKVMCHSRSQPRRLPREFTRLGRAASLIDRETS